MTVQTGKLTILIAGSSAGQTSRREDSRIANPAAAATGTHLTAVS